MLLQRLSGYSHKFLACWKCRLEKLSISFLGHEILILPSDHCQVLWVHILELKAESYQKFSFVFQGSKNFSKSRKNQTQKSPPPPIFWKDFDFTDPKIFAYEFLWWAIRSSESFALMTLIISATRAQQHSLSTVLIYSHICVHTAIYAEYKWSD